MISQTEILTLLHDYGLLILAPLAVVEGPIISVLAGWLVSLGAMPLATAYVILVLADLVGDTTLYLLGRFAPHALPARLQQRVGARPRNLVRLRRNFRDQGPRILMIGKLTHAAGFAVLVAAGVARMRFSTFLLFNLLGTLPKTAAFLALGYALGNATAAVDSGLLILSLAVSVVVGLWILRLWHAKHTEVT